MDKYTCRYQKRKSPHLLWIRIGFDLHDLSAKGLGTRYENLERLLLYNIIFIQYGTFELRIRSEFYCSNDVIRDFRVTYPL